MSWGYIPKLWPTGDTSLPEGIQYQKSKERAMRRLLKLRLYAVVPALDESCSHEASSCLCGSGFGGISAYSSQNEHLCNKPQMSIISNANMWGEQNKGDEKIHLHIFICDDTWSLVFQGNHFRKGKLPITMWAVGQLTQKQKRHGIFLHIKCTIKEPSALDDSDGNWQTIPLSIIFRLRLSGTVCKKRVC